MTDEKGYRATTPVVQVPVVRVAFEAQVDGGRNPRKMSIETYCAQDLAEPYLHTVADKLHRLMKRQTAICEIENIKEHIKHIESDILLCREQMAKIDVRNQTAAEAAAMAGRRHFKPPEGEEASRRQLLEKVDTNLKRIEVYREQAAAMQGVIEDVGVPDCGADNQPSV